MRLKMDDNIDITKDELIEYEKRGAVIIDVRSPQEFREGHLDGAICIPEYNIRRNFEGYGYKKEQLLVLYCSTGERSKKAQIELKQKGYKNVYNLEIDIF